jgi:aminomethyltransferase
VTIANETEVTHVLHLTDESTGDAVEDFLRRSITLGADDSLPREPHSSRVAQFTFKENPPGAAKGGAPPRAAGGGAIRLVRENRTGVPGLDVRCPSSHSEEIRRAFLSAGAQNESPERLESLRIAAGIPRWGAELTEAVLPDEAGLRERGFISETKGCYVGQEIVARIKTYGHVNRRLVLLEVLGGVPRTREKIFFGSEECGAITSAAAGGASGGGVALAYVKRERAAAGTALTVSSFAGNLPASVAPVPLV